MFRRDFYALIKNVSFYSPTDVVISQSGPFGASVLVDTRFLLQLVSDLTIQIFLGLSVLASTLGIHDFWSSASSLTLFPSPKHENYNLSCKCKQVILSMGVASLMALVVLPMVK